MRSWPPWVKVIDDLRCPSAISSLGAARSSRPVTPMSTTSRSPLSSVNTSSEPRRSTLLILAPSSRAWNALLDPLRWTALATGTSTDLTRRPTSRVRDPGGGSRSRGAQASSFSNSATERGVGVAGGDLLGLLLRPAVAVAPGHAADVHRDVEAPGVVGPLGEGLVRGLLVELAGRQLLEPALVVLPARAAGVGLGHPGRRAGAAPARGPRACRPPRRRRRARPRGRRPGSTASPARPTAPRPCPAAGSRRGSSSSATSARVTAFTTALRTSASSPSLSVGVGVEDVVGDDQAQHRVAEELEPLVGVVAGVLGAPRPVDERRRQHVGAVEGDAEALGEFVESV